MTVDNERGTRHIFSWRLAPWGLTFSLGFLATILGQVLIGMMMDDIGTTELSMGQQGLLAAGAFIAAAGTLLVGDAMPDRPEHPTRWENLWWGPLMTALSAAVLLMSLLGIWIIPEALGAFSPGVSSHDRLVASGVTVATVFASYVISILIVLFVRHRVNQSKAKLFQPNTGTGPVATTPSDPAEHGLRGLLFALIIAIGIIIGTSWRRASHAGERATTSSSARRTTARRTTAP